MIAEEVTYRTYSKEELYSHWSLKTERGNQWWEFDLEHPEGFWSSPEGKDYLQQIDRAFTFDKSVNANSADKVYRYIKSQEKPVDDFHNEGDIETKAKNAAHKGFEYYQTLLTDDGNFPGDYGGPMFLMPGLVFASYITGQPFSKPEEVLIKRNMLNHQNPDGGWGLHIEGKSTMFGTVMQYVSLRLLGMVPQDQSLVLARSWIKANGGATSIPMWGKFYLALLNLYDWNGLNTLLPELWTFPKWMPINPGRYWCHNRMVYLPMSYLYGNKFAVEETDLIRGIRQEIFTEPYSSVNWKQTRDEVCEEDVYHKTHWVFKAFMGVANLYEKTPLKSWRKKAMNFASDYIDHEDIHTNFVNIGPVNQAINSIAVWHKHGEESQQFKSHVDKWKWYLWLAEDGMKMGGYNGSQLWDTAFAGQALLACNLQTEFKGLSNEMYRFIEGTQIQHDPVEYQTYFRNKSEGCWPFSTIDHAWPVTDCTSEGMKTALMLQEVPGLLGSSQNAMTFERLKPAIDYLLEMQNPDGGWASYESKRAPKWIEVLNPASVFENIMVEYTYTECSSATMQGLKHFSTVFPDYRQKEIKDALSRGAEFIRAKQDEDGSWYGCWGVCYTYGTWFGVDGLLAAGANDFSSGNVDEQLKKACDFLVSIQREDGAWGESFESCVQHKYVPHEEGQIINTAWALMALIAAKYPDKEVIEKGVAFLIERQDSNGDFPQEAISGVFNGNCMETYTSYRNVFPLWALGKYINEYTKE